MQTTPTLRRWLSFAGSAAVIAVVFGVIAYQRNLAEVKSDEGEKKEASKDKNGKDKPGSREWTMWGGTVQRNLVNTFEKDMPTDWNAAKGKEKNIKWSA